MRIVNPPVLDSPWQERPGDDLDGLLTAYFHRELPSPWPAAPEAEEVAVILRHQPAPRKPFWTSRLALAASVAVLLAGGWMLSGTFHDVSKDGPEGHINDGTATRVKPFKMKTSLQQQPDGQIGIQIDVLPDESKEDEIEKKLGNDIKLPRE